MTQTTESPEYPGRFILTKVALWGLRKIYRRGYKYQKAGVILSELVNASARQADLFDVASASSKSSRLMDVIDSINNRMGRGTIKLASEGTGLCDKKTKGEITRSVGMN